MGRINWRSAEVVICAVLLVQILVMLIDLDTKNRLLKASLKLQEVLKDGKRVSTAGHERSHTNGSNHGRIPVDLVANGAAGMAEKSAVDETPGDDESFSTPIEERKA
jgi:hypothetical protein